MRRIGLGVLLSLTMAGVALITLNCDANTIVAKATNCSDGWRITGYFTPVETDYKTEPMAEIDIKDVGKMSFNADFVRVIFDEEQGFGEGWGRTRFGWYLGNYDGQWHRSNDPLDSNNAPLKTNSIAVDNTLIPYNSMVTIPNLPGDWSRNQFIANDVGVTVHGKHIDIYTGEGKDAETAMYRVTFEDLENLQRVCFVAPGDKK